MRSVRVEESVDSEVLDSAGLTVEAAQAIYRLLAIAKYDERFVVPTLSRTDGEGLYTDQGRCGFK
jgi:nitrate reductase beta subunit